MSIDGQLIAGAKNRVTKSQGTSELHRIQKEEKAEMRMHNTSKQRFRAKYAKLDYFADEAADVRLFETHTPGFCYRRNGECRVPQPTSTGSSLDFDDIHSLLFTEGEVDIEKVLCLHLLTAHKTETLTPPSRYHKAISFLAKEQSPLERLIERSKKRRQEDSISNMLPTYVLDFEDKNSKTNKNEVLIRDGRLAARVIINDRIVQLVHTVIYALQMTNPDKTNELLTMAKEPECIKEVVEKPLIQQFINLLHNQMLVLSCECFHLTQPFKAVTVSLRLDCKSFELENLVKHIRQNVLQLPSQSTWKSTYNEAQPRPVPEPESSTKKKNNPPILPNQISAEKNEEETLKKSLENQDRESKKDRSKSSSSKASKSDNAKANAIKTTKPEKKLPNFPNFLGSEFEGVNVDVPRQKFNVDNKKADTESIGKSSKILAQIKEDEISQPDNAANYAVLQAMNLKGVTRMLSKTKLLSDLQSLNESVEEDAEAASQEISIFGKSDSLGEDKRIKDLITQTRCAACVEKWRIPLPKPMVSRTKKVPLPTLDQVTYKEFATASIYKLNEKIKQELMELKTSKTGQKQPKTSMWMNKKVTKGNTSSKQTIDGIDLNVLDLAKIAQEIKEKETQKKLSKFLNNKI